MVIILAPILAASGFMDFVAVKTKGKALKIKDFFGAPGTIRTCDRLVRSQFNIPLFSDTCAGLFWPLCPVSGRTISNLAEFFGLPFPTNQPAFPVTPEVVE